MNVAFTTSGHLPVPPTKWRAVENLVYDLMNGGTKDTDIYCPSALVMVGGM